MVSFEQFKEMEIKIGRVLEVEEVEGADKLYLLTVDIGEETRKMVAGIKLWYKREELVGKNVVVLANLEPKVIRGVESNGMVLATLNGDRFSVLTTERDMPPGSRVS
ncbi:MAG: methionine--tRNA ligase subunit beta [Candidatus Omnitrophica bacterium]|nr:methionine--tRNA ligase subunit beta [Candidatus Omnitrophota bacterium]